MKPHIQKNFSTKIKRDKQNVNKNSKSHHNKTSNSNQTIDQNRRGTLSVGVMNQHVFLENEIIVGIYTSFITDYVSPGHAFIQTSKYHMSWYYTQWKDEWMLISDEMKRSLSEDKEKGIHQKLINCCCLVIRNLLVCLWMLLIYVFRVMNGTIRAAAYRNQKRQLEHHEGIMPVTLFVIKLQNKPMVQKMELAWTEMIKASGQSSPKEWIRNVCLNNKDENRPIPLKIISMLHILTIRVI